MDLPYDSDIGRYCLLSILAIAPRIYRCAVDLSCKKVVFSPTLFHVGYITAGVEEIIFSWHTGRKISAFRKAVSVARRSIVSAR
jgi:hypothetical protein